MHRRLPVSLLISGAVAFSAVSALSQSTQPATQPSTEPTTQPAEAPPEVQAPTVPPESWVAERVGEARERLSASEPGRLAWQAIEAHGGLERWFGLGALEFRFDYRPLGERGPIDTVSVVDIWSSRAHLTVTEAPEISFGWTGEVAWLKAPEGREPPTNPRFWALTPYYFVGVPFVMADRGAVLTDEGEGEFEGRTYHRVRLGFEPGTGDAPDDYYIVYIDQETHRVGAVRYVVTYPGFFPEGGASPERFMAYDGEQTIAGLVLAESYRTFETDEETGVPGSVITRTRLLDLRRHEHLPPNFFEPPEGAEVLEGY